MTKNGILNHFKDQRSTPKTNLKIKMPHIEKLRKLTGVKIFHKFKFSNNKRSYKDVSCKKIRKLIGVKIEND